MKILLTIIFSITTFFFFVNFSSAQVLNYDVEQTTYNTTRTWGGNSGGAWNVIGQSFIPGADEIDGMTFRMGRTTACESTPGNNVRLVLYYGEPTPASSSLSDGMEFVAITDSLSQDDCNALLPLGSTDEVNFYFPDTASVTSTEMYTYVFVKGGSANMWLNDYQNTDVYADGDLWAGIVGSGSTVFGYDWYFKTFSLSYDLEFLVPTNFEYVQSTDNFIYSGTCVTNGANQLAFITTAAEFDDPQFTISCTDNTWSHTGEVTDGPNARYLADLSATFPLVLSPTGFTDVHFNGYSTSTQDYFLSISYPPDDGSHYFLVQYSDSFPFTFPYSSPDPHNTYFTFSRNCDSSFISCDTLITGSLTDIDVYLEGFVAATTTATTTASYYKAQLTDSTGTNVFYGLNFIVQGTSSLEAPLPVFTPPGDCGTICLAIRQSLIPRSSIIFPILEDVVDTYSTKLPFVYFFQAQEIISSWTTEISDNDRPTTTLAFDFLGTPIELPVFTNELWDIVDPFREQIRTILNYAIWLWLVIAVINLMMSKVKI